MSSFFCNPDSGGGGETLAFPSRAERDSTPLKTPPRWNILDPKVISDGVVAVAEAATLKMKRYRNAFSRPEWQKKALEFKACSCVALLFCVNAERVCRPSSRWVVYHLAAA